MDADRRRDVVVRLAAALVLLLVVVVWPQTATALGVVLTGAAVVGRK
jgi:hypothetical protein